MTCQLPSLNVPTMYLIMVMALLLFTNLTSGAMAASANSDFSRPTAQQVVRKAKNCLCRCRIRSTRRRLARRDCAKGALSGRCAVMRCKRKGRRGFMCCDKMMDSPSPSPTPKLGDSVPAEDLPPFCGPDGDQCPGLGQGFYLPNIDSLATLPVGKQIFSDTKLGSCAFYSPKTGGIDQFFFYKSMTEIVGAMETSTSIEGSYKTLQLSLDASVRSKTSYEVTDSRTVMSSIMQKSVIDYEVSLKSTAECLQKGALTPSFVAGLNSLPLQLVNVSDASFWTPYVEFLKAWGSHVVTNQFFGSKFQRWNSVESDSTDIRKTLEAKACADIEGITSNGGWSVSGCAGYSKEDRQKAESTSSNAETVIIGGDVASRNSLLGKITPETLSAFISSGSNATQAVQHNFVGIWDVINFAYNGMDADMQHRSITLKAAFEGWLGFKCPMLQTQNAVGYQEMLASTTSPVTYSCWNRRTGCNNNDDCHIGGAFGTQCYCYGQSCIGVDGEGRDNVQTSESGSYDEGGNNSCRYQFGATCDCDRDQNLGPTDRTIWPTVSVMPSV